MIEFPHAIPMEEVWKGVQSSSDGLASPEVIARRGTYGLNEIKEPLSRPAWRMLLGQFIEPMILLLIGAAVISAILGEMLECIAILAIVVLFGILGFLQEYRAEKAIAALKKMASPAVCVRRDGAWCERPARDLVPGDVVMLETGNIVPADLRVTGSIQLAALESALTGESEAIEKQPDTLLPRDCPLGDRRNMMYAGTIVVKGRGEGVVTATGMQTELGKIADMIQGIKESATPLQKKLGHVGMTISIAGGIAAAAVFVLGVLGGQKISTMLLTAVSLAVAVIPEGLPAVITATLALGGRRMLKRNALIRRLPAVETLGAVTVICTDKTGTLTENRMSAVHIRTLHHDFNPETGAVPTKSRELHALLTAAILCNDGQLLANGNSLGDPTETALLAVAEKLGHSVMTLQQEHPRIGECAFDSDRKRMSTLHCLTKDEKEVFPYLSGAGEEGDCFVAVKGSPDGLLALSGSVLSGNDVIPMSDALRAEFTTVNEALAAKGIRVMGFALRGLPAPPSRAPSATDLEKNLLFCGLIGLMEPPRPEVRAALARCRSAGIRTMMITGDHPLTAAAIAGDLGLGPVRLPKDITTLPRAMSGEELAKLSEDQLIHDVANVSVFARVTPEDKLRIVEALQTRGEIVAMTGDGVNDSPALKKAEIGVAMGLAGTDVAKASADMILLDDNFATIVSAAEEGRVIYDDLVRFIQYSFGGNLGKVLVMLLAPLCGIPGVALLPLHLLWLNLLTDGLMGLGLGLEAAEPDVMRRPPRDPDGQILDRDALAHVFGMGAFIAFCSLLIAECWEFTNPKNNWQTILFAAIGFAQIGQAWGLRAVTAKPFRFAPNPALIGMTFLTLVLQLGVMYIPVFSRIFKLAPLSFPELAFPVALGFLTFLLVHLSRFRRIGVRIGNAVSTGR